MKKMKKEKKKKEQTKRRWPIWLTILLAILGVGAISGVTVLGVYLAGGFAENIINPADIYFSYDENLYNDSTSQLEVTDDFTLMVDTSSGYVTEDEVTLSFSDSSRVTQREINGVIYIDNGVIQVKQTVRIREEFTVTLMRADLLGEDNEVLAEDWIKGGIANLVATSEYNQIPATAPLQIAVDVPVWGIEIASVNSSGKETDQIVTGENFTVRTRYIPEASQYIYSDDQNSAIAQENKRVKHTYYVADAGQYASAITTRYDDQYSVSFLAGNQTVDNITLRGYTFRHADDQIENENNAETVTDEAFYTQILGVLLSSGDDTMTFDMQDISIGMASVGRFTVSKSSQTISLNTEQSLRLYMNEYLYDDNSNYLGVNVYSTSGGLLEGMLPNIAINFSYNSTDPTIDSFMQVIDGDYVEVDGLRYYMPYSNVTNLNYSYWTIRSLREANVTMTVVLLIENENGGYSLFGEPLTYTVTLSVSEHVEEPLSWTSTEDIDVMLNYNSTSGNFGSYTIENLNSLKQIPSQNIYQDYRFFAYFGEGSKEDLRATVDSIIGPTGYNYDLSGIYATTENLLLFALNGTSITLQNSGSFRLYFGTIVTENNIPVYETDGEGNRTYRIAVMSQDYILVNCEKSLYQDSVSVGEVNTDAFTPLENGEFAIDQGNTDTLAVSFRVDSEAVSVFTDEYYSGYMSLVVRDRQNNDITTNFTVLSSQLTEEAETGDSILTYQIMVNTGANISELNGIYLSQFALRYDNTNGDVIEWTMPINDKTISIYSPEAQSIEVNTTNNQEFADYVNGNAPITVNQTLGVDGNFLTSITAGEEFASVDELLTALLGANNIYVIVTDQNGRVDTLSDSWRFALVEGSDSNVINLNGQTFTFRQADNAEVGLALVTIDGNASSLDSNQRLNFIVTSVGITNAESLSSWDPYPATTYDDEDYSQSDISNLAVTLYGAKPSGTQTNGGLITLADLVKFYIGEGTENQPYERYTRIRFTLSQQYLNDTTLTDEMIIDLFNNVNGMIILYDENGDIISGLPSDNAQTIKQRLSGQELSAIAFRNNFAIDHIIRFSITDTGANGAINSTLNLTIRAAYTVTAYNYPEDIRQPLYASVATEITNTVTNNYLRYIENESYTNTFASLYSATNGIDVDKSNTYYIVSRGSGYILINEDDFTLGTAYVGTFDRLSGEITFIDFWNTETRDYSITFTPEGENYFTFERVILFTVTRDLGVEGKDNTYYLINDSGASYTVEDFISTYRLSNRANLPNSLSLVYEFDNYFTVLSSADTQDHPIVKADDSPLLFDYNQKQLSTTLIVYYVNEGDGQRVELGRETIPIEIYSETLQEPSESYDIYSDIAEMITYQSDDTISAQVQNVGDTEYIMVQQGAWRLSSNFVTINSSRYRVYPSLVNLSGSTMLNYYEIGNYDDTLGTYINFFNNSSRIYQNVDDIGNPLYLVVFFVSPNDGNSPTFPGTTAVMYIPIIITSIGYNYVNYDESMVSENEKFATAITDPNSYIVGGVYTGPYQTIKAGQVSTIMKQYNFTDKDLSTGLYLINGIGYSYTASITYHPLTSSPQLSTSEDIIKGTVIESIDGQQVGTISLNHLSSVYQNFYFAVKYTISSTSESKDFYYVYKVEPDVIVEDPVYAYNHNSQGASEYLQGEQYQTGSVNFNEIFGGTTLAENQKRFNITKQFEIVSVVNEDASDQTTEPLTEIEINLTSEKMQLWIAVLNGDNVLYERSTPYTVKKPEDSNNIIIDLASIFDESANIIAGNTINLSILSGSGEIYYNDTMIFASLNETNEIESVTVGEDLYYDQEGWGQFIEIYFSSDNATMYYRPLTSEQITINNDY